MIFGLFSVRFHAMFLTVNASLRWFLKNTSFFQQKLPLQSKIKNPVIFPRGQRPQKSYFGPPAEESLTHFTSTSFFSPNQFTFQPIFYKQLQIVSNPIQRNTLLSPFLILPLSFHNTSCIQTEFKGENASASERGLRLLLAQSYQFFF